MTEVVAKEAKVRSVEDIEAEIVEALASRIDGADLMVIEVREEEFLPLFQQAISNSRHLFFESDILPVVRVKPTRGEVNLVLSLLALAFQECLNYYCTPANREETKNNCFTTASIVIRNSDPALVMDVVAKEFNEQILSFLAKE